MTPSIFEATSFHFDPVQLRAEAHSLGFDVDDLGAIHAHAAEGLRGEATTLPYAAEIQRSFGPDHDVSGIRAHVGGPAAEAAAAIGAAAYATGDHVAFASTPDLHTAAHEAAHVVQQRGGVQLKGGVGQAGDPYEVQADAIADLVVAGQSAADLLAAGPGAAATPAVQRKGARPVGPAPRPAGQGELNIDQLTEGMRVPSGPLSEVAQAVTRMKSLQTDSQNLLERWQGGRADLDDAMFELAGIATAMLDPLDLVVETYERDLAAAEPDADLRGKIRRWVPLVLDALNNVTRVGLILRDARPPVAKPNPAVIGRGRRPGNGKEPTDVAGLGWKRAEGELERLAILGARLGWVAPRSVASATAARHAHEVCPTGGREENPSRCNLPDSEREGMRRRVEAHAGAAARQFGEACKRHTDVLDAMIAKERAMQRQIIDKFVDGLASIAKLDVTGVGQKVVDVVADRVASMVADAVAGAPVQGERTKGLLAKLLASMTTFFNEDVSLALKQLDDDELRLLELIFPTMDEAFFARRLDPFVAKYRQQIDPLGTRLTWEDDQRLVNPPSSDFRYDVVRVRVGERVRFAQVAHETHYTPTDSATHGETFHRYKFLRWIDPQFHAIVDDAPMVERANISDMPLLETVGL